MDNINNLKRIREIYGATQSDISKVVGVNRSTLSLLETGAKQAQSSILEKLSLFYGVGPEFFYEKQLNDTVIEMIIQTAKKEKSIKDASNAKRDKAEEFAKMLADTTFPEARSRFMFSMKMLLATADYGELDDLKVAYQITEKMAARLNAIIKIREEEEKQKDKSDQATLYDLLDTYSD